MPYTLIASPAFQRSFKKLPDDIKSEVKGFCNQLAENPYNHRVTKLKNKKYKNTYRYRTGNYRILAIIDDQENLIKLLDVADRKDIYSKL